MKAQNITFLSVIFLTIFCMLLFYKQNNINIMDNFTTKYDNLDFDYLNDKDYNEKIKAKYYKNDDTKYNGMRVAYHPYQVKTEIYYGDNEIIRSRERELERQESERREREYQRLIDLRSSCTIS